MSKATTIPQNGQSLTVPMQVPIVGSVMGEDMKLEPARGFLHLERVDVGMTSGGLHIPDAAKHKLPRYVVIATGEPLLGPDGSEVFSLYKAGDVLLISSQRGTYAPLPNKVGAVLAEETCVVARVLPDGD